MSYEDNEQVVGKTGYVTVAVPGDAHAGEVVVRLRGGSESYIAYASQPLEVGVQVVVVVDRGARCVEVTPL
jgi:membrane protein implicated in regulation of membrane protease activity